MLWPGLLSLKPYVARIAVTVRRIRSYLHTVFGFVENEQHYVDQAVDEVFGYRHECLCEVVPTTSENTYGDM